MKRELTLQRAGPGNAETLTRIAIASKRHWNYPESWMQAWIPQLTITPDYLLSNESWVAEINGEPVAFYSLKKDGDALWLDHLWVLPDFIGEELGAFLFGHALSRGRNLSAGVLNIESDPNAAGFYEKMGACRAGEHQTEVCGEPRSLPILEMRL